MNPNQTDVVGEYLHEVELRLSGLPLLQRRELLADLAAHIATERTDRNVRSESELIEILERLGSPEVVAAAAYEEAGAARSATAAPPPPFAAAAPPPFSAQVPPLEPSPVARAGQHAKWIFAVLAVVGVVLVLCLGAALTVNRGSEDAPPPASVEEPVTPETPVQPG
ncbi:hypothetical protein BJY16_002003 [Actinoplanes octamycinicus]|uniref:Uncharacterized protein n=1 Tax=Actinoplanes octamycinicus TaxID=135948 RepID=A0A7W7M684_9ACTN|nr:hypothetical protein [Actinoplanes octamycinicus]MBB4738544.1 hypothetical protein [Actinoplanes octamycinicus]GIE57668.1 hypothetical protein Aoc01nite_30700 [Actinoplanes octamycinicus]